MSWKRKILLSVLTNLAIYLLFAFMPCDGSGGFIDFCADGIFQPIGILMIFAIQFAIFFNITDSKYYLSLDLGSFPNFWMAVVFWLIILWPFYINKVKSFFKTTPRG